MLVSFSFLYRTEIGVKCRQSDRDSKQEMMTALCGSTIITHYNRKTYRIDDIDFSMTPLSSFNQHGTNVRYFIFILHILKIVIITIFLHF